ncbi:extensin family protein [Xinfangfangia sp. CPCC 101601]|uniref:Extensin family protein n=1 Tax=Pseudogemmobacter lacusdianii TaxID=3069608 RepID=A0ABU0W072_9RHOB|nr:extensin family protein [Xinfangfangia sp. CPCC 101601]MDQ2067404.1 extensin family protein [Xinfangfangia sp. CPCC 101601]
MVRAFGAVLVLLGSVAVAQAEPVEKSLKPPANPFLNGAAAIPSPAELSTVDPVAHAMAVSLRPRTRPQAINDMVAAAAAGKPAPGLDLAAMMPEPEPVAAPPRKMTRAEKKAAREQERLNNSLKGSVCGVAAIKGEKIAPIKAKVQGCGLSDGVRVTSVSGVRLSQAATIDCDTAKALNTWVDKVVQPAYGGEVVELKIAAHYICRPRNNKKGAKVSEHGRGKAVDIGGFVMANGKVLPVLGGFNRTMRKAHKGACGIFGTTLGPGSDGYHEDHLHLDTARHRNGSYCR